MKRINLLFMSLLCVWISATAQVGQQSQEPVDSIKNIGYMDSLFQELPEVMIIGDPLSHFHYQYELNYDYTYSTIITIANTLFTLIVSTYGFNTIYKTSHMFITEHIRYSVLKE